MKNSLLFVVMLFIGSVAFGQKEPKVLTVEIQTSAECNDCKVRLEEALNYTKGVNFAELDLNTRKLTVKFKTAAISFDEIKKQISLLGYNADDVKADEAAFNKLPECCKPGGMEGHGGH